MEINLYAQKIHEQRPDFTIALGNEIYLTETREKGQPYYHFILIAKDALGHKALRELSSTAWYNSYFDRGMERVPTLKSELSNVINKYKGHLIATTACIGGELPKLLLARNSLKTANLNTNEVDEKINDFITFCINTFGQDNFFIECAPSTANDQILANRLLAAISKEYNIKLVVATDSHYLSNVFLAGFERRGIFELSYRVAETKVKQLFFEFFKLRIQFFDRHFVKFFRFH